MVRPRIVLNKIWEILKAHYNSIGSNANARAGSLVIDSLKQLALKFLEVLDFMEFLRVKTIFTLHFFPRNQN